MCLRTSNLHLPHDGVDAECVRVDAFLSETNKSLTDNLTLFRIEVIRKTWPMQALQIADGLAESDVLSDKNSTSHVALIDATVLEQSEHEKWIAYFSQQEIGVVVLIPSHETEHLRFLKAGAHGVSVVQSSAAQLAFALWSAHEQFKRLRALRERTSELETKLVQQKAISQAIGIVATQLSISESAALKHLRKEARQRRRSIHELAVVILEANRILGRNDVPPLP